MKYNVIYDIDEVESFRNKILIDAGKKPVFAMKCNQCLTFIGSYEKPEDIKQNYCPNCNNKIKEENK